MINKPQPIPSKPSGRSIRTACRLAIPTPGSLSRWHGVLGTTRSWRTSWAPWCFKASRRPPVRLLWEYDTGSEPVPQPGDLSIILDGRGNPLCLIETVEMQIKAFDQVDAQFAYEEGEGDRSLEYWRDAHWHYFTRTCPALGRTPTPAMPLVCERFRLAWIPPLDSDPTDE